MMCAERMWNVMIVILLGLVMGLTGSMMFRVAFVLQLIVMIMLLVRGFTNNCPSLKNLKRIFSPCEYDDEEE